jgi:hypothetical protein
MTPIAHIEKNCWLRLPMFKTKLRCSIKANLVLLVKTHSSVFQEALHFISQNHSRVFSSL